MRSKSILTVKDLRSAHAAKERELVLSALKRNAWSLSAAARELDVSKSALQSLVRCHGLAEEYAAHGHGKAGRPRKVRT